MAKITEYQSMMRGEELGVYRKAAFRESDNFNAYIEMLSQKRVKSNKRQLSDVKTEQNEDEDTLKTVYGYADRSVNCVVEFKCEEDIDICKSGKSLEGQANDFYRCAVNGETYINGNTANEIASFSELAAIYENVLLNLNKEISETWKFTYIDPKISKVELAIKKVDDSSLVVSIATNGKNKTQLSKILNGLHNRLMSKGWNCKTEKHQSEKESSGTDSYVTNK